ncbi:hypothetical protein [Hamadaea tsunoensis]|uniref:hypothetical protein n=1 Tax=Hamadaea tsunoensis TaxID=53368 RepID=UPI000420F6F1|nr:hypothetical protein [Hamadaea tsunoensis]
MRHLTDGLAEWTLSEGTPIEQFLGPALHQGRQGVRWAVVEPVADGFAIAYHLGLDDGGADLSDLAALPPLDPQADDTGGVVARASKPVEALSLAAELFGAGHDEWVNVGEAVEEYRDYVHYARLPFPLGHDAAVHVVQRIFAAESDDLVLGWTVAGLEQQTGCAHLGDLIFHAAPEHTAEEIVDHAWNCRPIEL